MQRRYGRARPTPAVYDTAQASARCSEAHCPHLEQSLQGGQFVAVREAIINQAGLSTLLTRALPVWGEGTLLGLTIAGIVQWFRPLPLVRPALKQPSAQSTLPVDPAAPTPLTDVAARRTLPTPAIRPDPPQEPPGLAS